MDNGDAGIQKFGQRTFDGSGRPKCHGRLFGNNDARHHPQAESILDSGVFRDACRNDRAISEPSMESGSVTVFRRRVENHAENTRSDSSALREN